MNNLSKNFKSGDCGTLFKISLTIYEVIFMKTLHNLKNNHRIAKICSDWNYGYYNLLDELFGSKAVLLKNCMYDRTKQFVNPKSNVINGIRPL